MAATSPLPDNLAARWLLLLLLAAGIYFFSGFIVPVLAALVIGFASWPLYHNLWERVGRRDTVAASIALIIITTVLIIPIATAFSYAFKEVRQWFEWLMHVNQHGMVMPEWLKSLPGLDWLEESWDDYIGNPNMINEALRKISGENIGSAYRWLLALGSGTFHLLLTLLFMLITLFFVFRDGRYLVGQIDQVGIHILPRHWQRFSRVVPATVSSTVTGMGLIAIGEGVILGIAYAIAGVPSPVALGVLTGFMALIPGGAPLSFTLVSIYLVATGNVWQGIGLMIWGSVELFIVDKTLRPWLVGGPIKLPFLPTFFGLVGGVATMGLVGLFVGPVLMALLVAIWREWVHSFDEEDQLALEHQAAQEAQAEESVETS